MKVGGKNEINQDAIALGISPDDLQPGNRVQQLHQRQLGPVPVRDAGGMNHCGQKQPSGIRYDAALASRYILARVVAPRGPFPWSSPTGCRLWQHWGWLSVPPSIGAGRAEPPQPAPKRLRPAVFGNPTKPCPRATGHGAPSAMVCRLAIRTVCRLPTPAGPRCAGVPWSLPGATRAPNAPIGNPSNH